MEAGVAVKKQSKPRNQTAYFRLLIFFTIGKKAGERCYFYFGWRDKHDSEKARKQGAAAMCKALWSDEWSGAYSHGVIYDQLTHHEAGRVSANGTITWI